MVGWELSVGIGYLMWVGWCIIIVMWLIFVLVESLVFCWVCELCGLIEVVVVCKFGLFDDCVVVWEVGEVVLIIV